MLFLCFTAELRITGGTFNELRNLLVGFLPLTDDDVVPLWVLRLAGISQDLQGKLQVAAAEGGVQTVATGNGPNAPPCNSTAPLLFSTNQIQMIIPAV